ncbi:MAG: hypothetical protein WA707_20645 [Pseudolabrys sp.]
MDAARTLPIEKRDLYPQRLGAMLTMRAVTSPMLMLRMWRSWR